jgi:hypothetical protein
MTTCYYCGVPHKALIERGQTARGKVWRYWRFGDNSDTWRYSDQKESVGEYVGRRRWAQVMLIEGVRISLEFGRNDKGEYGFIKSIQPACACRVCANSNTDFAPTPKVQPKTQKAKAPKKEQQIEKQLTIYD